VGVVKFSANRMPSPSSDIDGCPNREAAWGEFLSEFPDSESAEGAPSTHLCNGDPHILCRWIRPRCSLPSMSALRRATVRDHVRVHDANVLPDGCEVCLTDRLSESILAVLDDKPNGVAYDDLRAAAKIAQWDGWNLMTALLNLLFEGEIFQTVALIDQVTIYPASSLPAVIEAHAS
jgi:hypothetical protein